MKIKQKYVNVITDNVPLSYIVFTSVAVLVICKLSVSVVY